MARGESLAALTTHHKTASEVNRIFELGAGYGFNLHALGRHYTQAQLCSDDLNPDLISSHIVKAQISEGPYDIVVLSHVLEHIVNPRDLLAAISNNIGENGALVIEVPNEGGGFICQQKAGTPFHEPHITFFQISTLLGFFKRNFPEFEVVYTGTAGRLVAEEESRRARLTGGIRGFLRRTLNTYPPLLETTQKIFDAISDQRPMVPVDYADYGPDEARLYLRVVLKKIDSGDSPAALLQV